VRIKVDEDLPRAVATALKEAGHEACTVQDEHLGGAKDPTVWDAALREERLLVTADRRNRFQVPGARWQEPGTRNLQPGT
jgi:predicted nuclease of predicted toxin-antitoxin system